MRRRRQGVWLCFSEADPFKDSELGFGALEGQLEQAFSESGLSVSDGQV